jgi:Vitamin K-dependent gamma-carboxylase
MRAIVKATGDYLSRLARAIAAGWEAFWFTPADPTLLGVLRILTGLMLVYTHAVWGLALEDFFGAKSWLSAALVRALQVDQYAYSFWWWVPPAGIWYAHGLSLMILVLFTVGLWTRVTSVLALVIAISYANRVPAALFGLDQINLMLALYLAIGPSGAALSLDHLLARRRRGAAGALVVPSAGANLAQRLIQVHMCVIYFFAGVSKLQGPSWWNGEAMWRAFANLEYQSADMTWLAWHPWVVNLMTHVTVAWEIFFCVLIWNKLARPLVLALAVVLHVGIGACLGMWTFGLIMLVGCASFLPNDTVRQLVDALAARWTGRGPLEERAAGADSRSARKRSSRREAALAAGTASAPRGS